MTLYVHGLLPWQLKMYLSHLLEEHGDSPAPGNQLQRGHRVGVQVRQHKVREDGQEHQVRDLTQKTQGHSPLANHSDIFKMVVH